MYIKSVTVCNFKSYKDSISIDLSPECNVVVGRNGAGKSNFFAAIRFVLGDIFTNLRAAPLSKIAANIWYSVLTDAFPIGNGRCRKKGSRHTRCAVCLRLLAVI